MKFKRTRYQFGCLQLKDRKLGPPVCFCITQNAVNAGKGDVNEVFPLVPSLNR